MSKETSAANNDAVLNAVLGIPNLPGRLLAIFIVALVPPI
jgi:hypothetical protein